MRAEAYQNAYDSAISELKEIAAKFEQLSTRKNQVEGLVLALKPFFASSSEPMPATPASSEIAYEAGVQQSPLAGEAEPPEGYSFRDVPNPLPDIAETGGDPFQRRVKSNFRFRGLAMQRG